MQKLCACGCLQLFTPKWNKKVKFIHGHNKPWLGKKRIFSEEHRLKLSISGKGKKRFTIKYGEDNPMWRGDDASYYAKHLFLKQNFGKADLCENRENNVLSFKCTNKSNNYQWCKKTESDYTRFREDYYKLCVSCHRKYDFNKE